MTGPHRYSHAVEGKPVHSDRQRDEPDTPRHGRIIETALLVALTSCLAACNGRSPDTTDLPTSVHYEVTGNAAHVTVMYGTWNNGYSDYTTEEELTALPWSKTMIAQEGWLVVTIDQSEGTATCTVIDGNGTIKKDTITGPGSAMCMFKPTPQPSPTQREKHADRTLHSQSSSARKS